MAQFVHKGDVRTTERKQLHFQFLKVSEVRGFFSDGCFWVQCLSVFWIIHGLREHFCFFPPIALLLLLSSSELEPVCVCVWMHWAGMRVALRKAVCVEEIRLLLVAEPTAPLIIVSKLLGLETLKASVCKKNDQLPQWKKYSITRKN